jgi:SAM-dependent methyltransferase
METPVSATDATTYTDATMYGDKDESYFGVPRREIAPLLPERIDRVLEIGCGAGATVKWLRERHELRYAVGIEMAPSAARRAAANVDLVMSGNVETMALPEDNFDLILALDVLEHLVDPWEVVKRLHGILSPGGVIIASIPNIGHYSVSFPLVAQGQWNYRVDGILDRTHLRFFTRQSTLALLSCSGLTVDLLERTRYSQFPWSRTWRTRIFDRLLPRHLTDFQFLIRARFT